MEEITKTEDKASPVEPVVMCSIQSLPLPVQIRLRALEICLNHYGYANRSMLCELFGLSAPQVSKDIATYRELSDGGIFYNKATRRIEKLHEFKRLFNT